MSEQVLKESLRVSKESEAPSLDGVSEELIRMFRLLTTESRRNQSTSSVNGSWKERF